MALNLPFMNPDPVAQALNQSDAPVLPTGSSDEMLLTSLQNQALPTQVSQPTSPVNADLGSSLAGLFMGLGGQAPLAFQLADEQRKRQEQQVQREAFSKILPVIAPDLKPEIQAELQKLDPQQAMEVGKFFSRRLNRGVLDVAGLQTAFKNQLIDAGYDEETAEERAQEQAGLALALGNPTQAAVNIRNLVGVRSGLVKGEKRFQQQVKLGEIRQEQKKDYAKFSTTLTKEAKDLLPDIAAIASQIGPDIDAETLRGALELKTGKEIKASVLNRMREVAIKQGLIKKDASWADTLGAISNFFQAPTTPRTSAAPAAPAAVKPLPASLQNQPDGTIVKDKSGRLFIKQGNQLIPR